MSYLALQHLLSRKLQTLFTLLGIFIGTTAFIGISTFFQGFQDLLVDSLVSGDAHIKVTARERIIDKDEVQGYLFEKAEDVRWKRVPAGRRTAAAIENPAGWFERFASEPDVLASTPVYTTTALVTSNKTIYSLQITGTRPADQIKITNIESKMTDGSFLNLAKGTGGIIIGAELASDLAKQVGDNLVLTNTSGVQTPFKVVGIFSTGNKMSDRSSAYTNIIDAQKLGQALGKISQISVKVANYKDAATIATNWKATSSDKVESWDQANENLMSMFQSQQLTEYTVTAIIMMVAGFGIYNVLNMVVTQKRRDIAILRSMGYEAKDVIRLFLIQGILLGVTGGLLGCLAGYLISVSVGEFKMGGPTSGSFRLTFDFVIYARAVLISNSVALVASFYPAWSASKLTPIEIIRAGAE